MVLLQLNHNIESKLNNESDVLSQYKITDHITRVWIVDVL